MNVDPNMLTSIDFSAMSERDRKALTALYDDDSTMIKLINESGIVTEKDICQMFHEYARQSGWLVTSFGIQKRIEGIFDDYIIRFSLAGFQFAMMLKADLPKYLAKEDLERNFRSCVRRLEEMLSVNKNRFMQSLAQERYGEEPRYGDIEKLTREREVMHREIEHLQREQYIRIRRNKRIMKYLHKRRSIALRDCKRLLGDVPPFPCMNTYQVGKRVKFY